MAVPELVVWHNQKEFDNKDGYNRVLRDKSFHTDYYCFDSIPERECFWQYIKSDRVKEVYFTGMFTSKYNGLSIQYVDPETYALRSYYPDFVSFLDDDTMQIVEVKAENLIDLAVTKAKENAATEMIGGNKVAIVEEKIENLLVPEDLYPIDNTAESYSAENKMQYILIPSKKVPEVKI
jgi:hypothetical protein